MTYVIPISDARAKLPNLVDQANKVMSKFVISRKGEPAAVLMSADQYESLMETLDIMSDPKAVKDLKKGMEQIAKGEVVPWEEIVKDWGKKKTNKRNR